VPALDRNQSTLRPCLCPSYLASSFIQSPNMLTRVVTRAIFEASLPFLCILSLSIQSVLTLPLCTLLCIHPCSPYFSGLRPVYYTLHLTLLVLTQFVHAFALCPACESTTPSLLLLLSSVPHTILALQVTTERHDVRCTTAQA
jgi:hypothetical protein